jgi:hypothetical protein
MEKEPANSSIYRIIFDFYKYGELPMQAVLLTTLWVLIVIRLRVVKKNNIDFPSRWRTASGVCIVLTGFFLTVYFALQAGCRVLNFNIIWPAAEDKQAPGQGKPDDPTLYTDQQVETIMKATTALYKV